MITCLVISDLVISQDHIVVMILLITSFALRAFGQLTKTNDADSDASRDSDYENEDFDSEVDYVESDDSKNDECDDS
ncbi:hypothetical protein BpHYR1_038014 [Brachionus plicatilis]|uniref:Uncharacterized protein n=1 Tax=Brachionus plicatilis TaxID=10195 RepID=A0A3M7QPK7_BRAPC|nr:hypothetical protein BpHYR1_038014 [Brachionus plicatilis]